MIRSRPLQALMARLAWLAIALMLCAPLLSRALQSPGLPRLVELCTSAGMKRIDLSLLAPVASASTHAAHGMPPMPDDAGHAAHAGQAACDYCLLAVRLLPLLAVLLAWSPLQRAVRGAPHGHVRRLAMRAWPAHPARGPPLAA